MAQFFYDEAQSTFARTIFLNFVKFSHLLQKLKAS